MKHIILTQSKCAIVSDKDFDIVSQFKWQAANINGLWYAVRRSSRKTGKRTAIYMHRFILGITSSDILVDHKDRNGLNNSRSNLRTTSRSGNGANRKSSKGSSSIYLGVHFYNKSKKWIATIRKDGSKIYAGSFEREIDAAIAYDKNAKIIHGEYANLNFK